MNYFVSLYRTEQISFIKKKIEIDLSLEQKGIKLSNNH